MEKTITKIITAIVAFAIVFTGFPAMSGIFDAHAATVNAPAQVKNLKVNTVTQTSIKITWNKVAKNRNTKGYAIYRNGKCIKRVSYKTNSFNSTKLKAGTKYKFSVRAYNTYRQRQYYNSKTKKWQNIKPTSKQWKGKKARVITAYKYGKSSTVKQVTTKKVIKKKSSNPTNSKIDTKNPATQVLAQVGTFKFSSITPKTITLYGDYSIKYTVPSKGCDVEWHTSNENIATVSGWDSGDVNRTINVYSGRKAGKATITGTLKIESGIKYNGPTSIKFTVENTLYTRNADGSYSVEYDNDKCWGYGYYYAIIGGQVGDLSDLPDGTTIKVDAAKMNKTVSSYKVDYYTGEETYAGELPNGWGCIISSSNRDVVYVDPNYRLSETYKGKRYPSVLSGAYFVGSGTADVTFSNGKTFKVIATGKNTDVYNYVNFIKTWPSKVAGMTDYQKLVYTTEYLNKNFKYPKPCYEHDSFQLLYRGSGDCWAGNSMLHELCKEMGFDVFYRNASEECGGNHVNCLVTISGVDYIADGTPASGGGVETWDSYYRQYKSKNPVKRP